MKGNVGPNTKSKELLLRLITEAAKALRTFAALPWIKPFSAVTSATLYKPAKMLCVRKHSPKQQHLKPAELGHRKVKRRVNAMLLNEFLKEHKVFVEEQRKVQEQGATIAGLEKQVEALTAGLQKVSAQLELSKAAPQTVLNDP